MRIFIPHGGGPLPLLNDTHHRKMIEFLQKLPNIIPRPDCIIVISAHWEASEIRITSSKNPGLMYDYSGFPKESYAIEYPTIGHPEIAHELFDLFSAHQMSVQLMYPDADIPCIQISLLNTLDTKSHIKMGEILQKIKQPNCLILGSGFSFHHMKYFFDKSEMANVKNNI